MIVVFLSQQLGNQMFQYALGKRLETGGKKVKFFLEYYKKHPEHDLALTRFFGLELKEATKDEVQSLLDARRRLINRVLKKVFGRPLLIHEMTNGPEAFKSRILDFKRGILNGYWQSEKYFSPIADIIYKDFSFPEPSQKNKSLAEEMSMNTSVSIHVRRGDYLGQYPLLTEEYYIPAMSYFTDKFNDVHFYVFSNDIPWCREHLNAERITFVDWNTGLDSPFDMWLMTQCKHNIIANSTFSWWGAWLSRHEGKAVIAPKTWDFHVNKNPDIYCPEWILL